LRSSVPGASKTRHSGSSAGATHLTMDLAAIPRPDGRGYWIPVLRAWSRKHWERPRWSGVRGADGFGAMRGIAALRAESRQCAGLASLRARSHHFAWITTTTGRTQGDVSQSIRLTARRSRENEFAPICLSFPANVRRSLVATVALGEGFNVIPAGSARPSRRGDSSTQPRAASPPASTIAARLPMTNALLPEITVPTPPLHTLQGDSRGSS
jgi:hypothetical protein